MIKRIIKISYIVVTVFVSLLFLLYLLFNTHAFQNYLAQYVIKQVKNKFNVTLLLSDITYDGWSYFSLRKTGITTHHNDTLFYAGRIQFDITAINIDSIKFTLGNITVDEGLCKLITDKKGISSLSIIDNFMQDSTPGDTGGMPFKLILKNIEVMDSRFYLVDSNYLLTSSGFDALNMFVKNISFRSKLFTITNDSLNFNIRNLKGYEKSGVNIKSLNANAIICSKLMQFDNLNAYINNSHVKDYFAMEYSSWDDFSEFTDKVILKSNIKNSKIDIKDVALFAPTLNSYQYVANISGNLIGTLSKLRFKNIEAFTGKNTVFKGKVNITGLPNIEETMIDVTADFAQTNKLELEPIIGIELPEITKDLGLINFKGQYTGFYNDFVSYGEFESTFGKIKTDINMKLNTAIDNSSYSGNISFNAFDLGRLLHDKMFGKITGDAAIAGKGFALKTIDGIFKARFKQLELNNYNYSDISFNLNAKHKFINGTIRVNDENLNITADGVADLSAKNNNYIFDIQLNHANLKNLNFTESDINISTDIKGNFTYKNLSNNKGELIIEKTVYDKDGYVYRLDNILIKSSGNEEQKTLSIKTDFLDFLLKGKYDIENLYQQFYTYTAATMPAYFKPLKKISNATQEFNFKLKLLNTASIAQLIYPGAEINNLICEGYFNSNQQSYLLMSVAEIVKFNDFVLAKPKFKLSLDSDKKLKYIGSLASYKKNDTLIAGDISFKGIVEQNKLNSVINILDTNGQFTAKLNNNITFFNDSLLLQFNSGSFGSGRINLNIDSTTTVCYASNKMYINKFHIYNYENNVELNGIYDTKDTHKNTNLYADIVKVNLNTLNLFLPYLTIKLDGVCSGKIQYRYINSRQAVISDIKIKNLTLDNDTLGSYVFKTDFTPNEKGILVDIKSTEGKIKDLSGSGIISLTDNNLDLEVNIGRSNITSFQAFVKEYVYLYEGKASVLLNIKGQIDNPEIYGNLVLNQVKARVEYLKTIYSFSSDINFNKNIIEIEPFKLFDKNKREANVSGNIKHNNFSNFIFNINIKDFKNFEVLNTTAKDNGLFYGKAFASGNAVIEGNENNIHMDISVLSNKNTSITINPFVNTDDDGENVINFINYEDTLPGEISANKAIPVGFGIKLNLNVTADAEVAMIFDPNAEDNIKAIGTGNLLLELTKDGDFVMKGNYTLTQGDYYLTAANVVSKKFKLKQGSTIVWTGDPYTGRLDITGVYRLRTTINEIVSLPQETNSTNRIPVECIININGTVEKPVIGFDLNFPELDNYVTGTASSELSAVVANFRKETDLMNQQILFLLISGKFIPLNNNNTGVQGANIGQQTFSDLFTRSASGILNKFIPEFDVSIDMLNAADPTRGRAYLLSASKRFLDNRLEVQGSYATDNSQNNFTASYNIIKSGRLKSRIFNRSGLDPIYNRNIITSGVGLYYRKEFDRFIDVFKKQSQYNF